MEELKTIINSIECCSPSENKRYNIINAGENTFIEPKMENQKYNIYIPLDLIEEYKKLFSENFHEIGSQYLDLTKMDFFNQILLNQELKFSHTVLDALNIHDPELHFRFDHIRSEPIVSDLISENNFDISYLIPKQNLIDIIETSNKKISDLSDEFSDIYHNNFMTSLLESYDNISSRVSSSIDICESSSIPGKYINDVLFFLYHPQINKLLKHSCFETIKPSIKSSEHFFKIISLDEEFVIEFEKIRKNMPIQFAFELDNFQKKAICLLENNENVLVAAHTSAGKTVVAEYAIARSESIGKKTIYTSPIKALSNQKFYDFKKKFANVGIVTGDVQINETAQTVIMTTEILRSMLYRDTNSRLNDVNYVIFDEVHYINDEERGVVWEEILIMLPKHIKVVLLSATIPNCHEVANWIGKIRQQTINVIITLKRPVPLEHGLYYANSNATRDNVLTVINTEGDFLISNFLTVQNIIEERETKKNFNKFQKIDKQTLLALLDHLKHNNKLPCIIFVFSRQGCFDIGDQLCSRDFTTKSKKILIQSFYDSSISRISEKNRKLPQILWFREMCLKGIAVHHSGVLPILREIVEMLFQRELIKVLIATETFAIGVNMPAKTVVFSSLKKYSSGGIRCLLSSEYIQMAGRAGRRGQDVIGSVYILASNSLISEMEFTEIAIGRPMSVKSRFRLTYGMILNLLQGNKNDNLHIEHLMKSSFSEFIQFSSCQEIHKTIINLEEDMNQLNSSSLSCSQCSDLEPYFDLCQKYIMIWHKILASIIQNRNKLSHFLCQGRLIFIKLGQSVCSRPAIVIESPKIPINQNSINLSSISLSVIFPFKNCDPLLKNMFVPQNQSHFIVQYDLSDDEIERLYFFDLPLDAIIFVSSKKIKINVPYIRQSQNTKTPNILTVRDNNELLKLKRLFIEFSSEIIDFNIFTYQKIECKKAAPLDDPQYHILSDSYINITKLLSQQFTCLKCQNFQEHCQNLLSKKQLQIKIYQEKSKLSNDELILMPEYSKRIEILKQLNIIDSHHNLTLKGKVAVKFTNNFEIILTELLFNTTLKNVSPQQLAALLSCFTDQGLTKKKLNTKNLKYGLNQIWKDIENVLDQINDMEIKQKLITCERPIWAELMEGMYEWAHGCDFESFVQTTKIQEGMVLLLLFHKFSTYSIIFRIFNTICSSTRRNL
ncbi:hypothetical protein HZS_2168 [Henneguya salminicola]|nr:hypothetical protein HZS_2168 [Henneguya salminicola]